MPSIHANVDPTYNELLPACPSTTNSTTFCDEFRVPIDCKFSPHVASLPLVFDFFL